MSGLGSSHRRTFLVHSYEVDTGGRLAPRALCGYLQEAAGEDAARLGVSMGRLREEGVAWVLQRLLLAFARHPRGGETLAVTTWARAFERAVAWRDFEVHDETGSRVAAATSRWLVMDLATRRLTRLPESMRRVPVVARAVLAGEPQPLPPLEQVESERRFDVRRSDLDILRHVNNTRYVEWVLEAVPDDVLERLRPASVDVEFRREALPGDVIFARAQRLAGGEGMAFAHELRSGASGHELARGASRWAPERDSS
jgi:acyl-ACP thioesterase